ncbi:putative sulfate exporter family transporter, partial [Candidatus Ozemobacteraceae bacterium]|nr:putative sulfate exporter family transporter [Candidatus Ozemobacteraceae bacterium]
RLLQISVIALGFGVPLSQILNQAWDSIPVTICGLATTLVLGTALGTMLGVGWSTTLLVSFGTAICGGSAIAAMAPAIRAKDEEIAISLATVFLLNAVALLAFPLVGHAVGLTQHAFGVWSGLAIHDTSSVVGAASSYGAAALDVGITVKLTRTLWIMPSVLLAGILSRSKEKAAFPLFILGFLGAAVVSSLFPAGRDLWTMIAAGGRQLLVVTLFLVGSGLSRKVLETVGFRPLALGAVLWILVSLATLAAIQSGWA